MSLRQNVLLIEQHRPTRALYARALQQEYQVFACGDMHAATAILQHHPLAGIVLEPWLLHGHAWAFVEAVRGSPTTRHMPIVICSELDERRHGQEMGVTSYLLKPVLPNVLLDTVRQILTLA